METPETTNQLETPEVTNQMEETTESSKQVGELVKFTPAKGDNTFSANGASSFAALVTQTLENGSLNLKVFAPIEDKPFTYLEVRNVADKVDGLPYWE